MADISVTAGNVARVEGTVDYSHLAGETLTAGMSVYLKISDSRWWKAQKDGTPEESGYGVEVGITLNGAAAGQPVSVQCNGTINMGATLTVGETYIVSATAGGVAPIGDVSTHYVTTLGVATTAARLKLAVNATGIQHA